jgi:hypothetical protein
MSGQEKVTKEVVPARRAGCTSVAEYMDVRERPLRPLKGDGRRGSD